MNWSYAVFLPASRVTGPILATEESIVRSAVTTNLKIEDQTNRILLILAVLLAVLLIIVIWLSWLLARMITRPVDQLRAGATALGQGDLSYRVDIRSGDEFEDLARSFNRMAGDLKENIEVLKITTAEKERYTKELEIAKEIQDSFLPETVPRLEGYGIAAANEPAMEIGGDLYDFIPAGKNREGFVIADVSGKGVSAALYMALSRTLLHASGEAEGDPSRAVRVANRLIAEDARSGMFITVFYGVLDAAERTFTYVNAGHNPPLLVRRDGTACWLGGAKGIALGVVPEVNITPASEELAPGDVLVLYTDGVTEAFNTADEFFGEERLAACIGEYRAGSAEEILAALLREIRAFTGAAPQSDDITVIVIRVL
jgi:sigma-B regulation protein RsbU (phosphoserine phosphatase)